MSGQVPSHTHSSPENSAQRPELSGISEPAARGSTSDRTNANAHQIGGAHYRAVPGEQHWDRVARLGLDYWQAMITRYVERWRLKGGVEDLRKAHHFLEKYIELIEAEVINDPTADRTKEDRS